MNLLRIFLSDKTHIGVEASLWLIVVVAVLASIAIFRSLRKHRSLKPIELNIQLAGIGTIKLQPNWEDVQVAHKIWAELVTRKAAIEIDPENDVIVEVYDSWYALFQRMRQLLADVPSECIRTEKSTQKLVDVAVSTLNLGLRPHLTKWQALFRNWWTNTQEELRNVSPQEHQRKFPQYQELVSEMRLVNQQLIQYASQLKKLVDG
jgi:hypothetical protein